MVLHQQVVILHEHFTLELYCAMNRLAILRLRFLLGYGKEPHFQSSLPIHANELNMLGNIYSIMP